MHVETVCLLVQKFDIHAIFFFCKFGIKITHVDNIFYIDKKCGNNSCQKDDGSKEREKILDFWRILGFTASDRKAVVICVMILASQNLMRKK